MLKRIYLIHILIFSGILLAACAPSLAPVTEPTTDVFSTIPANSASISGTVWHDLCALSAEEQPSAGCVALTNGGFKANSTHDSGEPGFASVLVTLGYGTCDNNTNRIETRTNQDGVFEFTNLPAGVYCVIVDPLRTENVHILPGGWTFPTVSSEVSIATISVDLAGSEQKTGIDFGWDTQLLYLPSESEIAQPLNLGSVNVQALNLRAGPSLNHHIFLQLNEGTVLEIMGRSENQEWLQVRLESGTQGWVYYQFVDTRAVIADLPLREAYGGAYLNPLDVKSVASPQQVSQPQKISVGIENNVATININGFIANAKLIVKLERPDGKASLVVGKGQTNANGNAIIKFEMPVEWPDGKSLTSGELGVVVSSKDGNASVDATIQYYR